MCVYLVVDFRGTDMIEAGEDALPHHGESYTIVQGPVLVQPVAVVGEDDGKIR